MSHIKQVNRTSKSLISQNSYTELCALVWEYQIKQLKALKQHNDPETVKEVCGFLSGLLPSMIEAIEENGPLREYSRLAFDFLISSLQEVAEGKEPNKAFNYTRGKGQYKTERKSNKFLVAYILTKCPPETLANKDELSTYIEDLMEEYRDINGTVLNDTGEKIDFSFMFDFSHETVFSAVQKELNKQKSQGSK